MSSRVVFGGFGFAPACRRADDGRLNAKGKRAHLPGLKMVWPAPWGEVAKAHPWRNIIVHQTEGPAGSARGGAREQSKNPTRRGVMIWVETDGTVYWAVAGKFWSRPMATAPTATTTSISTTARPFAR